MSRRDGSLLRFSPAGWQRLAWIRDAPRGRLWLLALAIGAVSTQVGVLGFLVRSSPIASFAVHARPRRQHQDRHRDPNRFSSPGGVRVGFCLVMAPP
jgi:hypothetical protein